MKLRVSLTAFFLLFAGSAFAELSPETLFEGEHRKKNLVVKEWNTDPATKTRRLDRMTIYNEEGRKIEEIEYASYGQRLRSTFEYYPAGKIRQEVEYDDKNKPKKIRKYEYNEDGTKKIQYNYQPNGKLHVIKNFEYIYEDAPVGGKNTGIE